MTSDSKPLAHGLATVHMLPHYLLTAGNSAVFGYASLVALQIKVLWGAWQAWDLPLWDGAQYFYQGYEVANSFVFPRLEWAPFFSGYYALFHVLLSNQGPFAVYFAHRFVTMLLTSVLFYALARAILSPSVAWLLTAFLMISRVLVFNGFVVHVFVLVPLIAACLASLSKSVYRNGLILASLLLAWFARPEYILSFAMALVVLAIDEHVSSRRNHTSYSQRLRSYAPLLLVGVAAVVMLVRAPGGSGVRSWVAFSQHYAWGYQERHPEWDADTWLRSNEAIELSFREATSLTEAALHNPSEMVSHLLWNVRLFPGELDTTLLSTVAWPRSEAQRLVSRAAAIVLLLFSLAAIGWRLWLNRSEVLKLSLSGRRRLWFVVLASSIAPLLSALILRPRPVILGTILPAILLVIGLGMESGLNRFVSAKRLGWTLPLAFVLFLGIFPEPFSSPASRPNIATVEALPNITGKQSYGLLAESARAFCSYTEPERCRPVEYWAVPVEDPPFSQFIAEYNVRLILANDRLAENLPPGGQAFMEQLPTNSEMLGWLAIDRVGGFAIYTRID